MHVLCFGSTSTKFALYALFPFAVFVVHMNCSFWRAGRNGVGAKKMSWVVDLFGGEEGRGCRGLANCRKA